MSDSWINEPIPRGVFVKRIAGVAGGLYLATPALRAFGATGTASAGPAMKPLRKTTKKASELKFRFMNQIDGVPFYQRVNTGIQAAAKDLGIDAKMTGPARVDSSLQIGTVESWITQRVDVIAVSSTDPAAMTPTINKAIKAGITVVSWDVDAPDSKRLGYVDYWDPIKGPQTLWDVFMRALGSKRGEYAFITPALTSTTHAGWLNAMKAYQLAKFPDMKLIATEANGGDQTVAVQKAKQIIQSHPKLVGIVSIDAGGTPGIAQATKELGVTGKITTTGLSTPSQMKAFVMSGLVPEFVLWDPAETGYLTTVIAYELLNGRSVTNGQSLKVSSTVTRKIPIRKIKGHGNSLEAIQGPALVFDKSNVGSFGF